MVSRIDSVNSSELSSFRWFLEHVLELLEDENMDRAVAGIFNALATAAFRRSSVPILIDQFKQATSSLEQLQRSSRYH